MFKLIKKKNFFIIFSILGLSILIYISLWLVSLHQYPVDFGINFSPRYAQSLGLDWKIVYSAILTDLKPKYIRLSVPWDEVEKNQGQFNFDDIDYLLAQAERYKVKVTLVVGQKVPRWPECFLPSWSDSLSFEERKPFLFSYIEKTVKRYKDHPVLEYWQVENEPFIKFQFGECARFDVTSVKEEVALVRSLDPNHKIVMTDSGEMSLWYSASRVGDVLASTLYRVVISKYGFIWKYSYLPPGLYWTKARLLGKDYNNFFISELQAEPWYNGGNALNTPIAIQEKTMTPDRLTGVINYGRRVGASRLYFWGVEWWYWMKEKQNDSRYWETGKSVF